ncbi:uncharacterized protein BXZ73DRAFT_78405 [Epithele typhae]|uniref:uncharacterized protein n=1 Tax=Epithele typhae TaxID=378194 RepID=UPI002008A034|nr:uncharacterized protein BXZ73DRAFT_78405 [Epithele typhae]KAH9927948.1 hypothetical protein BXZ73DRAFT_78405 [Epithele typhae]
MSMYKLIRRISSSFFPRPDRPWSEDATSTAPQIGKKRRLSTSEHEDREATPVKKARADSEAATDEESGRDQERGSSPAARTDTEEVKEVTEGVREVELEDGPPLPSDSEAPSATAATAQEGEDAVIVAETETETQAAAAVPLPESPTLKAAEGEDQDAEGEVDVEVKSLEEAVSQTATNEASSDAPSVPIAADTDEVPGLSLASTSTSKPIVSSTSESS